MSGRLAFRRWLREALRGTQKGLVMSSAMAIGEIMIMNVTPVFIFVRVLSIQGVKQRLCKHNGVPE